MMMMLWGEAPKGRIFVGQSPHKIRVSRQCLKGRAPQGEPPKVKPEGQSPPRQDP